MITSLKRRVSSSTNYPIMFKAYKKPLSLVAGIAVALSFCTAVPKTEADADGVAEIAMELDTGLIMHEKCSDRQLPMASTTKIMSALIIAEDCDLSEVITVPDQAVGVEGSSIYLKHGEQISVRDLLYGLMLRSGNDSACALAIHHSGSIDKFVDKMNERAKEIGATDTHFTNPSGLPDNSHYTTAKDLCNIARTAMKNAVFREVVGTQNYNGDFRVFTNKNKLLTSLDGANGVKTGYTEKAGRCLVSSAVRDGMDVVCVVLNCYDMFERSEKIIEDCFNAYSLETVPKDRVFIYNGLPCTLDSDCKMVIKNDWELTYTLAAPEQHCTCTGKNYPVAKLQIFNQNDLLFSHDLFTIE